MKKLITLFVACTVAMCMSAQDENEDRPYFKWNQSVGISVGYAYDCGIFGSDKMEEGYTMPKTDMLECDLNLYGFFFGMGFDLNPRNDAYYPYHKHNTLHSIKFGASVVAALNKDNRFIITPYAGWIKNKNSKDYYEDYNHAYYWDHERKFIYGCKLQYAYKLIEVGAFSSNRESGLTIGVNLNCKPQNKHK